MKDVLAPAEGNAPAQTGFHEELGEIMSSSGKLPAKNIFQDAMSIAKDIGHGLQKNNLHLTENDVENLMTGPVLPNRAPGLLQTEIKIGMQVFPHASQLLKDMSIISHQEDYDRWMVQAAHYNLSRLGSQ